jgi:hypothetical protein
MPRKFGKCFSNTKTAERSSSGLMQEADSLTRRIYSILSRPACPILFNPSSAWIQFQWCIADSGVRELPDSCDHNGGNEGARQDIRP